MRQLDSVTIQDPCGHIREVGKRSRGKSARLLNMKQFC